MQPPEAIATNYFAVAGAMSLITPRLRRAVLPLNSSCMTLVTFSLVAVENSYILSRRLRHHCAIINYRVLRRFRRHHRSLRHRFFVVFISL